MRAYLSAHRVPFEAQRDILAGFDLNAPTYLQAFVPGDELFQFVRNPMCGRPDVRSGNWFCLAGATAEGLAILGGGAGRTVYRFVVNQELAALEGTAAKFASDEIKEIGGKGGATQVFVPRDLIGALTGSGPQSPW